jgi:hypothetical protein
MDESNWSSIEDFATLFQYFWYRDFPIRQKAIGARRADWTIHIGIVVRNISDLIGLYARFEHGKRKDAILRSTDGDEIAIEWEWDGVKGNELKKLKSHKTWRTESLKYAVLITYVDTSELEGAYYKVIEEWESTKWPLLLILIEWQKAKKPKKYSSGREFKNIQMSMFHNGERRELRSALALPWEVRGTRWSSELK